MDSDLIVIMDMDPIFTERYLVDNPTEKSSFVNAVHIEQIVDKCRPNTSEYWSKIFIGLYICFVTHYELSIIYTCFAISGRHYRCAY